MILAVGDRYQRTGATEDRGIHLRAGLREHRAHRERDGGRGVGVRVLLDAGAVFHTHGQPCRCGVEHRPASVGQPADEKTAGGLLRQDAQQTITGGREQRLQAGGEGGGEFAFGLRGA